MTRRAVIPRRAARRRAGDGGDGAGAARASPLGIALAVGRAMRAALAARRRILLLRLAPERHVLGDARRTRHCAQHQEIEGGAEPRMRQQARSRACAGACAKRDCSSQISCIGSEKRRGSAMRVELVQGDAVGGAALRLARHARPAPAAPISARQYAGHSSSANRNAGDTGSSSRDARIGAAQAFEQHARAARRCGWTASAARGFRQQRRQQAVAFQAVETRHRVAGQEQLQAFLEQPRRRRFGQQRRQPRDRLGGGGVDREIRAWPPGAPRAACAPDPRDSAVPGSPISLQHARPARPRSRRRSRAPRNPRSRSTARWR